MPKTKKNTAKPKDQTTEAEDKKTFPRLFGMKDLLGLDSQYYDYVIARAREFAKIYGFSSIKTPILETYDLYKKSTRKNTGHEFYSVLGGKNEKITLRPEITQGVLRAYVASDLNEQNSAARLFSLGPIFRYDKLQTGHYRESTQLNLEIIGDDKPLSEALLIALANSFFAELGIKVQVQINSIGQADCQREYCNKLLNFYKERGRRSKLCRSCKNNLNKNCLGLLDCQEESCLQLHEEAPQIVDHLSAEGREHFTKTLEFLDELNVNYNFNPYLVRGLNYYNDTVFEFWPLNNEGVPAGRLALAGGGRYDSAIEDFGGLATPAVGLAIGLERTIAKIKDKANLINKYEDDIIFIAQLGNQARIKAFQLFIDLRQAGFKVRQSLTSDSLRNQLEEAVAMQAKTSLILGKKEIMDGTILLRDMDSGTQETIVYKKIKEHLNKKNKLVEKKINNRKGGGLYGRL